MGHGSGSRSTDSEEHGASLPTAKEGTSAIAFCYETMRPWKAKSGRAGIRGALFPSAAKAHEVAEHNVQLQRMTRFKALSKRLSLWVVLQVHLPLIVPQDLPQQDVTFFTR